MKLKAPIYQFAISAMLGGLLTYYVVNKSLGSNTNNINSVNAAQAGQVTSGTGAAAKAADPLVADCNNYNMKSRNGFSFVKPLLYTEQECESSKLIPLKEDINSLIESKKAAGLLSSVSVYVRTLAKGDWTTYNDGETFHLHL